jgi:soluble lytic murein transglycosylase
MIALAPGAGTPARADTISAQDVQIYRDALKAAERGNFTEARRLANRARTELPAKLIRWMDLTRGGGSAGWTELRDFIEKNPDWPNQVALRRNAESAMPDLPAAEVAEWFAKYPPVSTGGFLRHVDALMALRRSDEAIAEVRRHYVHGTMGSTEERDFRRRFNSLLRPEDHWARIDRLLWDGDTEAAQRNLTLVDKDRQNLALARIALINSAPGVEGAINRVTARFRNDPGLLYERIRWRRKKDLDAGALELLAKPPENLGRPEAWWTERHILARRLIDQGRYAEAYRLAAAPGAEKGLAFAQAQFLAGFLSLRFLKQPDKALAHFESLYRGTESPISKSRGAYWAGRAAEALGMAERAQTWYGTAARHGGSFYGQLAADELGMAAGTGIVRDLKLSDEGTATVRKREMVRLTRLLRRIEGNDGRYFELFMRKLMADAKTAEEYQPIAAMALEFGRRDLAVFTARQALQDGVLLVEDGYPVLEQKLPRGAPDAALVHAIVRQESSFEVDAVSKAGARGLMQIMPATGQGLARKLGIKHSTDKLVTDPDHNVRLGSTYLNDLLQRFGGSYVLTVAAYNAGQGNVAKWLREVGDPRSQAMDVIDWIELLPFYETRNYVHRVLENVQVYRSRLGLPPVRLTDDLARGAGGSG